jgi:phage gp29-like protein
MREAVWFGRYGAQVARGVEMVQGVPRRVIVRHLPVHGDKILTDFDGFDAVAINATAIGSREHDFGDEITYTDRMPVLRLRNAEWRQRFIVQKWRIRDGEYFDPYSAGQVGGIGLRHYIYWAWWLRDEMLSWATDFLEKVGSLGLIIFYYEEGNDGSFQKASQAAKDASNQNAIAVPIPKGKDPKTAGFDIVPANVTGAQFLKEFIGDYFERHIERMVVGQTLSGSAEGSGLGGTGVARLHMDTKFQLLAADAECFDDGYTEDLVRPALELNWPGCPYRFRWKHLLPDPEAEGKLAAAQTFVGMGGEIEEDEARELAGLRVPQPGARTLGGKQVMSGAGTAANGEPTDKPNDDDKADDATDAAGDITSA